MSIEFLGWGPAPAHAFSLQQSSSSLPLVPGRVVRQERGLLTVQTAERAFLARPAGRLLHHAPGAEALPTIGDWVALNVPSGEGEALLQAVLPRHSVLMRREAGSEHEGQLIAANLDVVFLVTGLDGNFNPRRIERALTVAWNSGAAPVVVLSKADLDEGVSTRVLEVKALAPGVPVLALSALEGTGIDALRALLPAGKTGALLGSSGVGKSTLVNRLLGEARLATQPVSAAEDRGRHTTTHRELFVLPHGGLLIDGPGMRELGLWGEEDGLATRARRTAPPSASTSATSGTSPCWPGRAPARSEGETAEARSPGEPGWELPSGGRPHEPVRQVDRFVETAPRPPLRPLHCSREERAMSTNRSRTVEWKDPMLTAGGAQGRTGLAFLRAIIDGTLPQPPICSALGFALVAADEGTARFRGVPEEYHYNPMASVHGGYAATLLDSAMGSAVTLLAHGTTTCMLMPRS